MARRTERGEMARGELDDALRKGPGRPTGRSDKRTMLIDAAVVLFGQQGMSATTLKMIADHVGLTPAMAHYYFNSRDELIDALAEERLLPVCLHINAALGANDDDPISAIQRFVDHVLEATAQSPWWASLWVREMLSEGSLLRDRVETWLGETGTAKWARSVEVWQQQGKISPEIEPTLVFTSMMALILLPLASGWDATDPAMRQRLATHVTTIFCKGVA